MTQTTYDWRLPENRREAFQRFYSFHLKYKTHPGCVYFVLPEIAAHYADSLADRAWLVWLNGNTENPATTLLLLRAAPHATDWQAAVSFWNDHFKELEWDTDRRHQKSAFGRATERWAESVDLKAPQAGWLENSYSWDATWRYAVAQPYMGRLSAWSMAEYARILLPGIPDADTLMLDDRKGSTSHRDGLAVVAGYDAAHWTWNDVEERNLLPGLTDLGESLLEEAQRRNPDNTDVCRLSLESALCTYKSWHKPNRRYPNVYADMMAKRLWRAEKYFGVGSMDFLWEMRYRYLPDYLRVEDCARDPGLSSIKQNWYRNHGVPVMMHRMFPDMDNELNQWIDGRSDNEPSE